MQSRPHHRQGDCIFLVHSKSRASRTLHQLGSKERRRGVSWHAYCRDNEGSEDEREIR